MNPILSLNKLKNDLLHTTSLSTNPAQNGQNDGTLGSLLEELPSEVILEVFALAADLENVQSNPRPLLTLTHVNRRWRDAAISYPKLWSKIPNAYGALLRIPRRRQPHRLEGLKAHLQRAQTHPISFWLDYTISSADPRLPAAERVLDLLLQHCAQWEDVRLTMNSPWQAFALARVEGNVPQLKRLRFEYWSLEPPPRLEYFRVAPALRSLFLDIGATDDDAVQDIVAFPWSQLEEFEQALDTSGSADIGLTSVMTTSTNLRALTWRRPHPGGYPWVGNGGTYHHSVLSKLEINFGATPTSVLLQLCLPALQQLVILSYESTPSLFRNIATLLTNSECTLRALSLSFLLDLVSGELIPGTDQELTRLLYLCPSLSELELSNLTPILIDKLGSPKTEPQSALSNETSEILPHLRKLTLLPAYCPDTRRVNLQTYAIHLNALVDALEDPTALRAPGRRVGAPQLELRVDMRWLSFMDHEVPAVDKLFYTLEFRPQDSDPLAQMRMIIEISNWKAALNQYELEYGRRNKSNSLLETLQPDARKAAMFLHEKMKAMEEYELSEHNMALLHVGNILGRLQNVARITARHAFGSLRMDPYWNIPQRARTLLERWKPVMMEEFREKRRWAYFHTRRWGDELYWIPRRNAKRMDDEKLWECMTSVKDVFAYYS